MNDYDDYETSPNYSQRLIEICDDYRTRYGVDEDPLLLELWGLNFDDE